MKILPGIRIPIVKVITEAPTIPGQTVDKIKRVEEVIQETMEKLGDSDSEEREDSDYHPSSSENNTTEDESSEDADTESVGEGNSDPEQETTRNKRPSNRSRRRYYQSLTH